jgi:hypothetical protein
MENIDEYIPYKAKQRRGKLRFPTEDKLYTEIQSYFAWARDNEKPLSIARLANWLCVDRKTLYNYKERDDFGPTICWAMDYILASLEERCIDDGKAGQIFILKNYGYSDKQEIESTNTNVNTDITALTEEERKKRLQELLNKAGE